MCIRDSHYAVIEGHYVPLWVGDRGFIPIPRQSVSYTHLDVYKRQIVHGFCKEVFRELPMEFAVEAQKLLGVSLEGSVG